MSDLYALLYPPGQAPKIKPLRDIIKDEYTTDDLRVGDVITEYKFVGLNANHGYTGHNLSEWCIPFTSDDHGTWTVTRIAYDQYYGVDREGHEFLIHFSDPRIRFRLGRS